MSPDVREGLREVGMPITKPRKTYKTKKNYEGKEKASTPETVGDNPSQGSSSKSHTGFPC